jgi:tRNA(Ile)-lysidine synthase
MALLAVLDVLSRRTPGFELVVAHLDHGRRGARGAADSAHVVRAAGRLGLDVVVDRVRIGRRPGGSWEAAARDVRYAFLERVAHRASADRVAVGHTADDQAETVIHRLCRGAGLRGMSAMPPCRPLTIDGSIQLVRPLLGVGRDDVVAYVRARGIRYRVDETNRHMEWTRNRLRHRILPMLSRDVHPEAPRAIARFSAQAAEAHRVVAMEADSAERRGAVQPSRAGYRIPVAIASRLLPAVRMEVWWRVLERLGIVSATFADLDAIEETLEGSRPAASVRGGLVIVRRVGSDLRLIRRGDPGRDRSRVL